MADAIPPTDLPPSGDVRPEPVPPPRKKHWGRRILIGVVVVLLLLAGLALLIPTIASTAPARRFVIGKINQQLNGTVEIQDWSLGWTGGIDVRGVKVFDDRKAEVLSVAHLHTQLSLVDALRGRYHCGDTVVDEPNLEQFIIYPDGTNNLERLVKKSNSPEAKPRDESESPTAARQTGPSAPERAPEKQEAAKSSKPLDLTGNFQVNRIRGLIQDQRAEKPIIIAPESSVAVKITGPNDPIENAITLVCQVGTDGAPGTLKLHGMAHADPRAAINETLELIAVPLAEANPFLAMAGQKLSLGGMANGSVLVKSSGAEPLLAEGLIVATKFTAGGAAMNGETYSTSKLSIPVKVTSTSVDPATMRIKVESLGVETDDAKLGITGDVSAASLQRMGNHEAPGDDGKLTASLRVPNLKLLADQLPKTLHLQGGVQVTGGGLTHETKLALSKDKAVLASTTDLENITGTSDGKPIALSPIHQTAAATLLPGATALPNLHDIVLTLVSGFASLKGNGATLASLDVGGNVDLPKMQKELGQFIDFGGTQYGGMAEFTARTSGDLTDTAAPVKLDLTAKVTDLAIATLDKETKTTKPLFADKQFAMGGNLSYDAKGKSLAISTLKVDLNGSDALHLTANGTIHGLGEKQAFENLKMTLGYDLEKLWPIIYPLLSPADQKDLKDAVVKGKFQKDFTFAGSYPSGKPFGQAVASLVLNGSIGVERFTAMGLDLANVDLPVSLKDGTVRLIYADKPEGQQLPPAAYCNGGQLNLAGPTITLTGPTPRVTTPKDWKLVTGLTINPLLGNNLGKFLNPVFTNSERAKGLLDVTVSYCDGVALGDAMKTPDSGKAKVIFSLRDMDIANPFGSQLIGSLAGAIKLPEGLPDLLGAISGGKGLKLGATKVGNSNSSEADALFRGDIKDAVVTLDAGVTTQDIRMELADPTTATTPAGGPVLAANAAAPAVMSFKGNVKLSDQTQNLDLRIPAKLMEKFIPLKNFWPAVAREFPEGIPVNLKGTTAKPQYDVEAAIPAFTKAGVNLITGGGKERGPDATKGNPEDQDPLGALINGLGKKKKKDKDK